MGFRFGFGLGNLVYELVRFLRILFLVIKEGISLKLGFGLVRIGRFILEKFFEVDVFLLFIGAEVFWRRTFDLLRFGLLGIIEL